jgi:drug/metabolite transporter (DMT)-like permease
MPHWRLPHLSIGRIAILQFVYLAVALLTDWLFLGEALSGLQLTGIVILSAAVWFAERSHMAAPDR